MLVLFIIILIPILLACMSTSYLFRLATSAFVRSSGAKFEKFKGPAPKFKEPAAFQPELLPDSPPWGRGKLFWI